MGFSDMPCFLQLQRGSRGTLHLGKSGLLFSCEGGHDKCGDGFTRTKVSSQGGSSPPSAAGVSEVGERGTGW